MKRKYIAAIIAAFLMALFILGLFWAGGFNFDERGEIACECLLATVTCSVGLGLIIANMPDR